MAVDFITISLLLIALESTFSTRKGLAHWPFVLYEGKIERTTNYVAKRNGERRQSACRAR